jgi:hypothetical protein
LVAGRRPGVAGANTMLLWLIGRESTKNDLLSAT